MAQNNSVEQSPSASSNVSSASQEITRILRNPKVPYLIHNRSIQSKPLTLFIVTSILILFPHVGVGTDYR